MLEDPEPSERLVLQRLRNRAIEAVSVLAEGDLGVRAVGPSEFFNVFYDVIDDDAPWAWRTWNCFTADEVEALDAVLQIVNAASDATPQIMSEPDLVGVWLAVAHRSRRVRSRVSDGRAWSFPRGHGGSRAVLIG